MNIAAAIMAGGRGERFWPKSRCSVPKQFLSLTGDGKTMLQLTVERISPLIPIENTFIITNRSYKRLVTEQLPNIPEENIICEPMGRNTAPCIAVAACAIEKSLGESTMVVLPSDHLIKDTEKFLNCIKVAIKGAQQGDNLVTLGIKPAYPETGYGYINFSEENVDGCYSVRKFVEKPDYITAEKYFNDRYYLWNSGMFIWRTSVILNKFKELMPEVYAGCRVIQKAYLTSDFDDVFQCEFSKMPSESVDYGIMERTSPILTVPGDFGWDDVGGWLAIERVNEKDDAGNVLQGECVNIDSESCTVVGNGKLIAIVGLKDIIVVDSGDAILICAKDKAQDVKKVISELKSKHKNEYL